MAGRVGSRMRAAETAAATAVVAPDAPTRKQLEAHERHLVEHIDWCDQHGLSVSAARSAVALEEVRDRLERGDHR